MWVLGKLQQLLVYPIGPKPCPDLAHGLEGQPCSHKQSQSVQPCKTACWHCRARSSATVTVRLVWDTHVVDLQVA